MKLSLITSFYNCEKFIDELANSILSQNHQDWEWVIADDFSEDGTLKKLEELAQRDGRIILTKLSKKKEMWWNPQFFASGDIVCPIDGDDVLLPGALESIVKYFNLFPDVVFLHFNANKYNEHLPDSPEGIKLFENFVDNVYVSNDNPSFLHGFQRLHEHRTGIFGYLRVFRNLRGLKFPHRDENDIHSSNDGQWLLRLEELGKTLYAPRTVYLARQHRSSENFRNWSVKGESILIKEAEMRRSRMRLDPIRKIDYFEEIADAAESVYLSRLNWEQKPCTVCFVNFRNLNLNKMRELFYSHEMIENPSAADYVFIKINSYNSINDFNYLIKSTASCKNVTFFCDNIHLRGGDLQQFEQSLPYPRFFLYQQNRAYFIKL